MKYDFKLMDRNIRCHLDIEKDIKTQKNGLFTFVIRVNQNCIMDYTNFTNECSDNYRAVISSIESECQVSLNSGAGGTENRVRGDNV